MYRYVRLSVSDIVFKSALTNAGDIERDVKFVEFKNMAGLLEAAAADKVAIAFAGTGHLTKATKGRISSDCLE